MFEIKKLEKLQGQRNQRGQYEASFLDPGPALPWPGDLLDPFDGAAFFVPSPLTTLHQPSARGTHRQTRFLCAA